MSATAAEECARLGPGERAGLAKKIVTHAPTRSLIWNSLPFTRGVMQSSLRQVKIGDWAPTRLHDRRETI